MNMCLYIILMNFFLSCKMLLINMSITAKKVFNLDVVLHELRWLIKASILFLSYVAKINMYVLSLVL